MSSSNSVLQVAPTLIGVVDVVLIADGFDGFTADACDDTKSRNEKSSERVYGLPLQYR